MSVWNVSQVGLVIVLLLLLLLVLLPVEVLAIVSSATHVEEQHLESFSWLGPIQGNV